MMDTIYDYQIQALNSEEVIDFADYKGKKILIVNVASKCGFTGQYEGLQKLYEEYNEELVIVGFPCNQFLFQESGSESKISTFCQKNYGVTFPMTTKIKVKGKGQHPIYKWLTSEELNGKGDYKVSWNFNKFLIDENGKLIEYFGSKVKPQDEELVSLIEG
nr:glutathione peroxidase [Maribacter sp.]